MAAVTISSEELRSRCGWTATVVWIASGLYLFATDPDADFLSWQAAVFFVVGMFGAAIVLGILFFAARSLLIRASGNTRDGGVGALGLVIMGIALTPAEIVITYLAAAWAFARLS